MIVPAFNQTVWTDWVPTSVFATWKPLAGLAALALVLDLAILTENPVILYPLALLSAVGVVVLLAMIYTMIWVMVFRKENRFLKPGQLIVPLVGGLTTAMLQIAVIDLLRFWLTGTWQGFNL
jgi:hypothetical protein